MLSLIIESCSISFLISSCLEKEVVLEFNTIIFPIIIPNIKATKYLINFDTFYILGNHTLH